MVPPNPYQAPNPYSPPTPYGQAYQPYGGAGSFAAFMEGPDLAVQKDAPLPDVCVKCGATPCQHRRNHQFVWNPPWIIFLFLLSPVIAAVVALIVQKKGRLQLPLCSTCQTRWTRGIFIILGGVLWLIGALIGGAVAMGEDLPEVGLPLMISAIVFFIVAVVVPRNRFLRAKRVDDRVIVITGLHPNAVQATLAAAQGGYVPAGQPYQS